MLFSFIYYYSRSGYLVIKGSLRLKKSVVRSRSDQVKDKNIDTLLPR